MFCQHCLMIGLTKQSRIRLVFLEALSDGTGTFKIDFQ